MVGLSKALLGGAVIDSELDALFGSLKPTELRPPVVGTAKRKQDSTTEEVAVKKSKKVAESPKKPADDKVNKASKAKSTPKKEKSSKDAVAAVPATATVDGNTPKKVKKANDKTIPAAKGKSIKTETPAATATAAVENDKSTKSKKVRDKAVPAVKSEAVTSPKKEAPAETAKEVVDGKKAKKAKKAKVDTEVKKDDSKLSTSPAAKEGKKAKKEKDVPVVKTETEVEDDNVSETADPMDDSASGSDEEPDVQSESCSEDGSEDESKDKTDGKEKKTRKQVKADVLEKNNRTAFVGNLTIEATKNAGLSALKRLFKKHGKVESIRFRSIARTGKISRKAAFITKQFHAGRDTLNAYVVYAEKESVDKALAENGTEFMGKHLRVDRAVMPEKHDTKRSVFLGSLPFDIDEESVRTFFSQCGDVENVRLLRDKGSNVGKGIGYVQYSDKAAVVLAMKLHGSELKGRKIRVNRCKDVSPEAKRKRAMASEGTRASKDDPKPAGGNGKVRARSNKAKVKGKGKPYDKSKRKSGGNAAGKKKAAPAK
ncbi:hypothetical protein DFS34DRAFT_653999 [Phlyctochytrium arcticum]|nr:hypothetical protein DFS34DRAFT_653999 [Phlyctochytrium arcticum]